MKVFKIKDSKTLLHYKFFFISNTFISDTRLKLAKNWAKARQHPEAKLLVFELLLTFSLLHPRYHPKIIGDILKIKQGNKCVCIHKIIRLIIMKMKMKMKNRSHK